MAQSYNETQQWKHPLATCNNIDNFTHIMLAKETGYKKRTLWMMLLKWGSKTGS